MNRLTAFFVLLFFSHSAYAIDVGTKVEFKDEFLGIGFQPQWAFSVSGTGKKELASSPYGGVVRLYATNSGTGTARMRLGEELGNSLFNNPNFSVTKNAACEVRVFANMAAGVQLTIGFVGINDPVNVGGALLFDPTISKWVLQTGANSVYQNTLTNFVHTPGSWFKVKIETSPTSIKAYVDGVLIAENTNNIPQGGLAFELQLWNRFVNGAWTSPSKWIDVVACDQDR